MPCRKIPRGHVKMKTMPGKCFCDIFTNKAICERVYTQTKIHKVLKIQDAHIWLFTWKHSNGRGWGGTEMISLPLGLKPQGLEHPPVPSKLSNGGNTYTRYVSNIKKMLAQDPINKHKLNIKGIGSCIPPLPDQDGRRYGNVSIHWFWWALSR